MSHDFVVQAPPDPDQLILLFHGVGSSPAAMGPFGAALARGLPSALVVAVAAPDTSELGGGLQWFSVEGISEANRPDRVAAALPRFAQAVAAWQVRSGLGSERTVLAGFSQGAIMALGALALDPPLAVDVVAVAGRFAALPDVAPQSVRVHLFHGEQDAVMPIRLAEAAARRLGQLGLTVTFDRFPGVGHATPPEIATRVVVRLLEARTTASTLHQHGDEALRAAWQATAAHFPPGAPLLYADLAEETTALVPPVGPEPGPALRLPFGAESLARQILRHAPPTALELEQAIETIEPEIMALGVRLPAGGVLVLGGAWPPALAVADPGLHRDAVEQLFQRLAAIAQGRPASSEALPVDPAFFAAALLLRELMHHLGLERAVAEAPAPSSPP